MRFRIGIGDRNGIFETSIRRLSSYDRHDRRDRLNRRARNPSAFRARSRNQIGSLRRRDKRSQTEFHAIRADAEREWDSPNACRSLMEKLRRSLDVIAPKCACDPPRNRSRLS